MSILKSIKLVTFDATNTLLNFRIPPWEYYATVAKTYGYKGDGHDLKIKIRKSYNAMSKEYPNFGKNSISWHEWWRHVVKSTLHNELPEGTNYDNVAETLISDFKTPKCWCKADGSENIIKLLQKSDITLGVISNFDPRLFAILKNIGLIDQFKFIITSYEIGTSKPDKRIFEAAQIKYGEMIQPEECLHIGDDFNNDYKGAKGAGWHAILVTENLKTDDVNPKYVYKSLNHLYEALTKK